MLKDVTQATGPNGEAEITLWGTTKNKVSVSAKIPWFRPYFYAHITSEEQMKLIRMRAEAYMQAKYAHSPMKHARQYILSCDRVPGKSMMWYNNSPNEMIYKITMALTCHIKDLRDSLDFANRAITETPIRTYEGNVPYELRFLVDHKLSGGQWIRLNSLMCPRIETGARSQVEFLIPAPSGCFTPIQRSDICAMRKVSYDIEVLSDGIQFPSARKGHPVICLAMALYEQGSGIIHTVCFTTAPKTSLKLLKECNDLVICKNEQELLLSFTRYIVVSDADLLTGWNTNGFDLPYLADRAAELKIEKSFLNFSRIQNKRTRVVTKFFQSKAYGAKKTVDVICDGRFIYDGLDFMQRGVMQKYRSYTLQYISQVVLSNDQKEDVAYFQIPRFYRGSVLQQSKLNSYCLHDAILPLKILEKQQALINGLEQARVTGIPFKWLMQRGQGIKTFSKLLRQKSPDILVPTVSNKQETKQYTAGGYVRDPKRGAYLGGDIIGCLDFKSLYPSIMQAHNICYSTIVSRKWAKLHLREEDYWSPPPALDAMSEEEIKAFWASNPNKQQREKFTREAQYRGKETDYVFVKAHIRKGILPAMLDELVATRRAAVADKEKVDPKKDPELYAVLDGRQNALKVVCNSVYGFVKAYICRMYQLMEAVCAWGREKIKYVTAQIVEHYRRGGKFEEAATLIDVEQCRKEGLTETEMETRPWEDLPKRIIEECVIVYGDTDSVMISTGGPVTLRDTFRLFHHMADEMSKLMIRPVELDFECAKVSGVYINKKRNATLELIEKDYKKKPGMTFSDAIASAKLSIKGLEGKRRDNALIGSKTQEKTLEILLRTQDPLKAEAYVKSVLTDLLTGQTDMSQLIISKGLSKTDEAYAKGGTKQQHVELAKRIAERCDKTGETPYQTGDRVPFVMVAGTKGSKAFERAEDPVYAQANHMPIDVDFYIDKQMWSPIVRVFTAIYEPERCVEIKSGMSKTIRESLVAHQRLFVDTLEHMRHRRKTVGSTTQMANVYAKMRCMECGLTCDDICCDTCIRWMVEEEIRQKYARIKKSRNEAWQKCLKCMEVETEEEVQVCTNKTCNNLYKRWQLDEELVDISAKKTKCLFISN